MKEELLKILEDVYMVGRSDVLLTTNDWATLEPGVLKKLTQTLLSKLPKEKKLNNFKADTQEHKHNLGYNKAIREIKELLHNLLGGSNV